MTVDSATRIRNILQSYRAHGKNADVRVINRGEKILRQWKQLKGVQKETNRTEGNLFNPLYFFSIGETKHSELLGFLLSENESHGMGKAFLMSLLKAVGVPAPDQGRWLVTVEKGRVDLLLKREHPRSVVIIENKSHNAVDQPHQLYRYWCHCIHRQYGFTLEMYEREEVKQNFKIIYLPSNGEKAPTENSLSCPSYLREQDQTLPDTLPLELECWTFQNNIAPWLQSVEIPKTNYRLKAYLEFYRELCLSL